MYDIIPFIIAIVFFALSLCFLFIPQKCLKEEQRNNEKKIKQVKRTGILYLLIAIIMCLLGFFQSSL